MKLNHINLGVTDVMATVDLFETHFGLRPAGEGMPRNERMAFLQDDNGSLISVFKSKDVAYPKVFHIGFMQENAEQVRAFTPSSLERALILLLHKRTMGV